MLDRWRSTRGIKSSHKRLKKCSNSILNIKSNNDYSKPSEKYKPSVSVIKDASVRPALPLRPSARETP